MYQLRDDRTVPDTSTDWGEHLLDSLTSGHQSTIDQIIQGAVTRLEKLYGDGYLRPLFDHVPADPADAFVFDDWLDEDGFILIDVSGPTDRTQRVLANLLLAQLWRALRRRRQRHPQADLPLAVVAIDEVPHLRIDSHLQSLLSMGREYGVGCISLCQSPAQLKRAGATAANADTDAYHELLTNSHTILTGAVSDDEGLVTRLSGSHMSEAELGNRLRNLPSTRWFFQPATPRDTAPIKSHVIADPPLPAGHPDGPAPLPDDAQRAFRDALTACQERTASDHGIPYDAYDDPTPDTASDDLTADQSPTPAPSPLALTSRLPESVTYAPDQQALVCQACERRYDPTAHGMERAITCCGTLADTDRADVPVCTVHLKLTPEERTAADWSTRQLLFLQAVYNAQQQRYDTMEFDIVHDSMLRLEEYVDIDSDAVDELCAAGLVTHDGDHPHRLYSVTPAGRDLLNEGYREGLDFGHGEGDLRETSTHVLMVEASRRYLAAEYAADPDSPVTEVVPYYELDETETTPTSAAAAMGTDTEALEDAIAAAERRRLDVAGLDAAGDVVVAVEAERVNNDLEAAAPADFDKLAACDPTEAHWVVPTQSAGHDVLGALQNPAEGAPRVEKTYAATTPPHQFRIDTAGLTDMYSIAWLCKQLPEPTLS